MMSRKQFTAVAAIVKEGFDWLSSQSSPRTPHAEGFDAGFTNATERLALDMADYFATENPNFDRAKFLTACGL
jgi:hypothetical protein